MPRAKPARPLHVVDLFAGCGGLSLGLEQAGFQPAFVNELNEQALATYLANREAAHPHLAEEGFHVNDVHAMLEDAFMRRLKGRLRTDLGIAAGELDLVVGGPPCQGYSGIGHRRSYSVDKVELPSNHLYGAMAAVVAHLRPRAFVFENVRGLLNARWTEGGGKGEIWHDVRKTFRKLGEYRIAWKLVFAKDYGVPQNRPRVLLVGLRKDVDVPGEGDAKEEDAVKRGFLPRPDPDVKPPDLVDLLGDLVDPAYKNGGSTTHYPMAAKSEIQRELRTGPGRHDSTKKGDALTEHDYSHHSERIVEKFEAMLADPDHEIPERFRTKKFAQRVLPQRWGSSGPTITATSLADDYVHFAQPRSLTVREWARLQTFPDWYQFKGKRTTGGLRRAGNPREGIFDREVPKYTQIGNAVPVRLAKAVGEHLARILRASS